MLTWRGSLLERRGAGEQGKTRIRQNCFGDIKERAPAQWGK